MGKMDDSAKVGAGAGMAATAGATLGFMLGGPIGAAIGGGLGLVGAFVTAKEINKDKKELPPKK